MSTLVDLLQPLQPQDVAETSVLHPEAPAIPSPYAWDAAGYAEAQMRSLVRQVFFPGRPKPPRHVLISAVDETTYVAEICMQVAKSLAAQVTGNVCVVETNFHHPELEDVFWRKDEGPSEGEAADSLRSGSQSISHNLWLAPQRLLGGSPREVAASSLARRLSDFRLEFDYAIFHGPPAARCGEAASLGHLTDGVVLVLEANATRRVVAQKTKEILQAAQARLLGVVLSERTFPIPEKIYRKL